MTLTIGDKAPDFILPADTGENIQLSKLRGQQVVIYFYPKDNTPGCTIQACNFRDQFAHFKKRNVILLGISKDSLTTHHKFKQKYALPFILLEDKNADVCEAYGVINKKSLFGKTFLGIHRSTFLIDAEGKIKAIWRKVKVASHAESVLNEI